MKTTSNQAWGVALGAMLATLLVAATPAAAREPWSAPLARGGTVEVDPRTNRPTLIQDGRETQLWDGVHRLQDGSVILIREGRVVPTVQMLAPPTHEERETDEAAQTSLEEPPDTERIAERSPCEELVMKVCGAARTCWRQPACEAARQLREMEQEDWLSGADPGLITPSGKQCREAMDKDFFAPCK